MATIGVALTPLMDIPKDQVAIMGADALLRLQKAPLSDQKRFLLRECVQAYLRVDESQSRELEKPLDTEKYVGVQTKNKTWFEKGEEKGIEKGRRETLQEMLEDRFGPLAPTVAERLQKMSLAELTALRKPFVRAQSLSDLGLNH